MMSFLEELQVILLIVRSSFRQVLKMSQLFSCSTKTLPIHLGDDSGNKVLIELHLGDLNVPGLDCEGVPGDHGLHTLGCEHIVS